MGGCFMIILLALIPLIDAGCQQCCPGRDLTCKSIQDPDFARKRVITPPAQTLEPNLAEVTGSTAIHKGHRDDVWHVHVDPRTNTIPGHGSVESFLATLQRLKARKLARLELPDDYDYYSNMTDVDFGTDDEDGILLDLASDTVQYDTVYDAIQVNGSESHRSEAWKFVFGESVHVPSNEYVDYEGTDPLIKYMVINDEIPMSVERMSNLKLRQTCYCDEDCRMLHDCCHDYHHACPAGDCAVSGWTGWGHCHCKSESVGVSERTRRVLRPPQHGGLACPNLTEQKVCQCQMHEVALLLPYKFSVARVPGYNDDIYYDLNRHIQEYNEKKSHCIIFEVDWLHAACKQKELREDLRHKNTVCVECQIKHGQRCNGEGVLEQKTFWTVIGHRHCTGRWKRTDSKEDCKCSEQYFTTPAYIFV